MPLASAFQQRFLLGPLIALALVGADPSDMPQDVVVTDGRESPSGDGHEEPGSSSAKERFEQAKADLLLALDAERVFFVDNLVFAAAAEGELTALQEIEPKIEWGTGIIVESPSAPEESSLILILRASLGVEGSLCLSEISQEQDAGLWYARVPPGSPCPPYSPGMPGWTGDEGSGWGAAY